MIFDKIYLNFQEKYSFAAHIQKYKSYQALLNHEASLFQIKCLYQVKNFE